MGSGVGGSSTGFGGGSGFRVGFGSDGGGLSGFTVGGSVWATCSFEGGRGEWEGGEPASFGPQRMKPTTTPASRRAVPPLTPRTSGRRDLPPVLRR